MRRRVQVNISRPIPKQLQQATQGYDQLTSDDSTDDEDFLLTRSGRKILRPRAASPPPMLAQKRKKKQRIQQEPSKKLEYPFISFMKTRDWKVRSDYIPDKKLKPLKDKCSRPCFAYEPYSWEIDHIQHDKGRPKYLIAVNINTRYVYCILVPNKTAQSTKVAIQSLIDNEKKEFGHPVKNIRCDGDLGFVSLAANKFGGINYYISNSKFTFHNKIVDATIRTLRDALQDKQHYWNGRHDAQIQQLVKYYNNSWHRGINMKPIEMHKNILLEWRYIRRKTEELNQIKKNQINEKLWDFKNDDRIMVYLDLGKTSEMFTKKRRKFDRFGKFIRYEHGNAIIRLDEYVNGKNIVEVPLFHIAKVAQDAKVEQVMKK